MSAIRLERNGMPSSSNFHYALINHFNLPENITTHLEKYYLLKWDTKYFFEHMVDGTIEHQGIVYVVIYHNKLFEIKATPQIALSFRKVKPEIGYTIPPYVIVKKA